MVSNISMLDIEELKETKLKPYIEKSLELRAPDPAVHAMMGHNIDIAEAAYIAWVAAFNEGELGHKIKEIIRVSLSRQAHCSY